MTKAQLPKEALKLYGQAIIKDNDFPAFCKLFLTEADKGNPFQWQSFYDTALEFIIHNTSAGILAPRGHGKSTVFCTAYTVFEALKNPDIKIAIASNTESTVDDMLKPIINLCNSPKFKAVFGNVISKEIDNRIYFSNAKTSTLTPEPTISVYSAKSGKITGKHFDMIIVDDIVTALNCQTPHGRKLTLDFYSTALLPTLRSNGKLLILGTRYNPLDLYGVQVKLGFPLLVFKAINELNEALAPGIMNIDKLRAIERSIGKIAFASQYQNDASLMAEGNLVKPESLLYYQDRDQQAEDYHHPTGQDYRYIQTIDLAVGGKDGDFSVCIMSAYNTKTKLIYIVDIIAKRCPISEFKKLIRVQWLRYREHYPVCYCEANGFQTSILQGLNDEFNGQRINPIKNTVNKYSRFVGALAPVFDSKRIYINKYSPNIQETETQLFALTPTGSDEHDDIPDTITMALEHLPTSQAGRELIIL